jgi:predicted ATP-grasp superfamily ATP-dependent carboligase
VSGSGELGARWGAPACVLVTDGDTRAALACVRALASRGHRVHVAATAARSLAAASRYCAVAHAVGDPSADPRGFAERIEAVAAEIGADWILPLTEVSLGSLYAFGVPERRPVACPERAAYEAAVDKHALLERAAHLGLATPHSVLIEQPSRLSALPESFRYPVVLKARRSRFLEDGRWVTGEVRVVRGPEELALAGAAPGFSSCALLQEFVPGSGEGVFLLCDRGRALARFAHRRLREKPPWGGVSVLSEAIAPDPELLAQSERLLAELAWTGVAMVEFRRAPGGPAYLMEVNPRLWGSLQLAIDAGVDFPSLWIALLRGAQLPAVEARLGTRTRWLLGDLDRLLTCLRRPDVRRQLGVGVPALLVEFARSFFDGSRLEVLRRDDWRPFVYELREWARAAAGQR